ncbi:hypothetical protein AC1031_003710 [Aphanomyces cochlioides]|nr:hypothetical protein AC1031_003710 [Aphanomyces cochlioides]
MFVEPTKGYMKDGMKGAGTLEQSKFVNRVAVGAHNEKAAEQGKEKHRLFEMNKLTNWVTGVEEDRAAVQAAFLAARAKRPATAVQENVTPSPPSNSIDTAHKDEGEEEEEDASPPKYIQQTSHGTFTMDCVDPELRLKRETAFARTRKNRKAIVNDTWEDRSVPFSMSIAMLVVGLPSDVESFVSVAKALEFDGHRVCLAAAHRFEAFITSHGIEYVHLEGNAMTGQERLATTSAAGAPWQGFFGQDKKSEKKLDTPWSNDEVFAASAWQAVKGSDFRADLIVSHPDVMIHLHLAERLGVPLHLLSDELSNWFSYSEVHKFIWNKFSKTANKLRVKHLNLPAWNAKVAPSWWQWHIPVSYNWSSLLLSKREDWGEEVEVVGFLQLPDDQVKLEPRPELADFVAHKGSYRVYISLPALDPNVLISMAEALVASHPNVLVIIGQEGDKNRQMLLSYRLLVVDASTPLKWLIKHTHAVIHQANDPRLLAEILHQNKPSVTVPITAMERQCKLQELAQVLIAKVEAETPSFWSPEVMTESKQAIRRTVSSIYKHLPIEAMQCDVIPSKIAHVYDPVMKMKFSHEAAYVASQLESNKVEMYAPLIYSLNEPPQVAIKAAGRPAKAESAVDAVVHGSIAAVRHGLSSQKSVANIAINTSSFWKTQLDETEFRKRVSEGYDRLQATRLLPRPLNRL